MFDIWVEDTVDGSHGEVWEESDQRLQYYQIDESVVLCYVKHNASKLRGSKVWYLIKGAEKGKEIEHGETYQAGHPILIDRKIRFLLNLQWENIPEVVINEELEVDHVQYQSKRDRRVVPMLMKHPFFVSWVLSP